LDEFGEKEGEVSSDGGSGVAPLPSRSAPRLSFEAVVRLSCAGRRGIHTGFVRDIARGGMFLRLVDPEPPGRRLGFELFLPGWRSPARGVGEVAWNRPTYEGPGRPPGMAIRFVALEPRAIEMLAAVLPAGEAPEVEVLQPRPLPPVRRDEKPAQVGSSREVESPLVGAIGGPESPPARGATDDFSLETLLAESGFSTPALASSAQSASPFSASEFPAVADLDDDSPMIFVPPPPAQVPLLAVEANEVVPLAVAPTPSRLRWGSAAAGIAALASLATLVVVGAARFDMRPSAERETPAQRVERHEVPLPSTVPLATARLPASVEQTAGAGPEAVSAPPHGSSPPQAVAPNALAGIDDSNAPVAVARPATRLTGLRWEPLPGGGTRVTIALDGSFAPARLRASRIGGDAPRLVVRLLGLGGGAPRAPWEPSTPEVRRIRSGRHDGDAGPEIHLVLDLADSNVRLVNSEVVGAELRLDLAPAPADVR